MNKNDFEVLEQIRKWKRIIDKEITKIKLSIKERESFLFIEYHKYKPEEILESKTYKKINDIINNIGPIVDNWIDNGIVTGNTYEKYNDFRDHVDDCIQGINNKIIDRKQTGWEKFVNTLETVRTYIADKLPKLMIRLGKSDNDKPKLLE